MTWRVEVWDRPAAGPMTYRVSALSGVDAIREGCRRAAIARGEEREMYEARARPGVGLAVEVGVVTLVSILLSALVALALASTTGGNAAVFMR